MTRLRIGLIALTLLVTAACTLRQPLVHHATSYNIAVEAVQNRMLFLNIVRASERMPMYFTDIGSITAGLSYEVRSGSLGLTELMSTVTKTTTTIMNQNTNTTDARDVTDSETEAIEFPSISYSDKPTLTIAVRDDHEFMRGTLTPITQDTLKYYLDQGWNEEVLLYLLVERVELALATAVGLGIPSRSETCNEERQDPNEEGTDWEIVENDPENPCDWDLFRAYVNAFVKHECRLTLDAEPDAPNKTILYSQPSLGELLEAEKEGYSVGVEEHAGNPKWYTSTVAKNELILRMKCRTTETLTVDQDPSDEEPGTYRGRVNEMVDSEAFEDREGRKSEFAIFLRSPQGVLYYLGEIMRVWNLDPERAIEGKSIPLIQVCSSGEKAFACLDEPTKSCDSKADKALCIPLFLARKPQTGCSQESVAVKYNGKVYMIPKLPESPPQEIGPDLCHPGRSMQALTLVSQLISLQKKGEELPATTLVRVVGD
jgi:hypothetical protein